MPVTNSLKLLNRNDVDDPVSRRSGVHDVGDRIDDTARLALVCDDFHLPLAKLRCRAKGSSGGQKGLGDILARLGTEEVARLRIGVGEPPADWDPAAYVLGKFAKQELPEVEEAVWRAADAVVLWAREGTRACMNRIN